MNVVVVFRQLLVLEHAQYERYDLGELQLNALLHGKAAPFEATKVVRPAGHLVPAQRGLEPLQHVKEGLSRVVQIHCEVEHVQADSAP